MLLDLSRMRGAHDRLERRYPASAFDLAGELFAVADDVVLAFDIYKDHSQYHLVGRVATTLGLSCSRCLESFRWPVNVVFDLLYLPHSQNVGEGDIEVEQDDLTTAYYRDDTIDLGLLMREQFYLSLPMKPLCDEACRGLCPQCGSNLNAGSCTCTVEWVDPRLASLKSIFGKDE